MFVNFQVKWYKDNEDVTIDSHYSIQYSYGICSIEVQNAKVSDSGKYTCVATNNLGEHATGTRVIVEGEITG